MWWASRESRDGNGLRGEGVWGWSGSGVQGV